MDLSSESVTPKQLIVILKCRFTEPRPPTPAATPLSLPKMSPGEITRADADRLSVPPPGDKLTRLAQEAQKNKQIPACHQAVHVRLVNDIWMAPAPCTNCTTSKKTNCDRNDPCKPCTKNGLTCVSNGKMMVLRSTGGARMSSAVSLQNDDSPEPRSSPPAEDRKRQRATRAKNVNYNDATSSAPDTDDQGFDQLQAFIDGPGPSKRVKQDTEFTPDQQLTPADSEGMESPEATSVETKAAKKTNKKGNNDPYHRSMQTGKPEPFGKPPAWANRRQALCETLVSFFRAYDSAAYTNDGRLYGFLADSEVGIRDKFTDQVIITKCGGGKGVDENGNKVQKVSQADLSSTGLAFVSAMKNQHPVGLIAGAGNSASPSALPYYYNVLGYFHVTDVWFEKINGVASLVTRMEKIDLQSVSWWAPKDTVITVPDFTSPKASIQVCRACDQTSKVIYEEGFTCLQAGCRKFFEFDDGVYKTLNYTQTFLDERTEYLGEPLKPISPPLITLQEGDTGFEAEYKYGIVCPQCACCSRRIQWLGWICENEECRFEYRLTQKIVSPSEAIQEGRADKKRPTVICASNIMWRMGTVGKYDMYEYTIPGENGTVAGWIRVFKSKALINEQPDGPNDLFAQMQTQVFNLKRSGARNTGGIKEVLTAHFGTNWGAPYKYGVTQDSIPFSGAPDIVLKAVHRLTWAGQQALTANNVPFDPFNELLSLGYFEQQYIGWHDDGEKELGATIASLSLGADATMQFRPKAKSSIGRFSGANQTITKGQKRSKPVCLSFTISHGDLLVMHGTGLQKFYEHSVIPHGKLRYALTCRYIDPAKMKDDEARKHSATAGKLPEGSERFVYDGDIHSQRVVKTRVIDHAAAMDNRLDALRLAGDLTAEEEEAMLLRRLEALRQQRGGVRDG